MPPPHKKSFAAEQLALRQKNKVSPVVWVIVGVVVVALVVGGYVMYQRSVQEQVETEAEQIKSIAVLPFENISADEELESLCKGIAESIRNTLTNIRSIKVAGSISSLQAKEKGYEIKEMGEKLTVESVLVGSLQRFGDRLRISVELISVRDGFGIWSEPFERSIEDIFSIQDEITERIIEKLGVSLTNIEKAAMTSHPTDNSEAYQFYLKGRHFLNKRTKDSIKTGLDYFQKAIRKDPYFALAYAGMADSFNLLGIWGYMPPRDAFPKAKSAAQKALNIDDKIAEAHTSLGFVSVYYDWDWETAEKRFKQAIKLKPTYVLAHKWFAENLKLTGNYDEAIREFRKALDCDPFYLQTYSNFADLYLSMDNYEKALHECQKAIEIDKNFAPSYSMMGYTFANMNNYQEAINNFKKALELSSEFGFAKTGLGYTYAKAGNKEDAERLLKSLIDQKKREYISSYRIALIYLGLGEINNALGWLKNSHEERDPSFIYINGQIWDPIRTDPRFQELYQKIGFPEQ